MMPAAIADGGRLAAVRESDLLDRVGIADLDRLSRLAAELLGVPVSLVSLVAGDRQYFAGQAGLAEPWATVKETPLSHSLCQHVVAADAPLVIGDTQDHPLVGDNLAVRDLGVVAYAGVPVHDADGQTLGALCVIDGRPRRWSAHELALLGDLGDLVSGVIELHGARRSPLFKDALTGLPDRALLRELTDRAISRAARGGGTIAVVAIGLDGFRLVNEALGHAAGDELLVAVGERLTNALRANDAVCRVGGDEFLVVCERVVDEADALRIAERLQRAVEAGPYVLEGTEQLVRATIGLVTTSDVVDADDLMTSALIAMQRAKAGAGGAVERADAVRRRGASAKLRLRNAVVHAHRRGEMSLVYQPLVLLSTSRIVGLEALLRWKHPDLGPVSPDAFIPAAEESGAIVELGEWVLDRACADLADFRRIPGAEDLHVSVNIAPAQVSIPVFATGVATALEHAGVPPQALTLEITERTLLADRVAHRLTLEQLRELGVRLALDDFGTGFSSLGYLSRYALDDLKIDKMFIDGLPGDPKAVAIVDGILAMARALGLRTVAEGIETAEQLATLQGLGCVMGQGYHLSRPVGTDAVSALLHCDRQPVAAA